VALEQAKVELEKQKLQSDTASDAAELELKNKELEIKETAQIIDMLKVTGQSKMKEEQAQLNRESKEAIKEAEIQAKIQIEESKLELDQRKELAKYMSEMLKKQMEDQKEIDQTAIENMLKVANQQITEMRNDAER
jgi:predicted methyltransferase